jgi:nitroreductase
MTEAAARSPTETAARNPGHQQAPIPPGLVTALVAKAARAPSVHNTQPWRFQQGPAWLELHADHGRDLARTDPAGREAVVSCGAALFGLRLAIREIGYLPAVRLLPDPARPGLLALIRLGAAEPVTADERQLLTAISRRHTYRGGFSTEPIPAALLAALRRDAVAEEAALIMVAEPARYRQLADLVTAADRAQRHDAAVRAEVRSWTRPPGSIVRDGVPAYTFTPRRRPAAGRLAQRDFDLGRGVGLLDGDGGPPVATAVLVTAADDPAAWLQAGQALHRLLLRAASRWVFASLHTQPLELPGIRNEIRTRLALRGIPQMLLQLGLSHTAAATPRRPPAEFLD